MSPALALAEEVLVNTQKLVEELRRGENAENTIMRAKVADDFLTTSEKLSAALYGPTKAAFHLVGEQFDLAALKFVLKFDVLKHMDREGGTNVVELSKRINVDAGLIGRFLRLLSTRDLVKETGNGVFELTATSKAIIDDDEVYSCFAFMMDEAQDATAVASDFLKANPFPKETSDESIFNFRWNKAMYQYYEADPEKGRRFAAGMEGLSQLEHSNSVLINWAKAQSVENGKIIDVGGGRGHVAMELAEYIPNYKFVVQDSNAVMFEESLAAIPEHLRSRFSFQQHDFFQPQPNQLDDTPVVGYILRRCLHNWPDAEAAKITRAFVPALQANREATLLINESILPERSGEIAPHQHRWMAQFDLAMMVLLNAKQRTEADWRALVKTADEKLEVVAVDKGNGGTMGLVQVTYKGA